MRMSQTFGETLREPPADVDTPGYALLLRAGYLRPLAPGLFCYLPLGLRSLNTVTLHAWDASRRSSGGSVKPSKSVPRTM